MSPRQTVNSVLVAGLLALSGCGAAPLAGGTVLGALATTLNITSQVVKDGQEVCAIGQTFAAITDATNGNAPLLVTGKPATVVADVCKTLGGIVVSPPAAGTSVASISVVPPAITVSGAGVTTSGAPVVTITPATPVAPAATVPAAK